MLPWGISAAEREQWLIRALGHHFPRHRDAYSCGLDLPDAEVDRFAHAFLAATTTAAAADRPRRTALRAISR